MRVRAGVRWIGAVCGLLAGCSGEEKAGPTLTGVVSAGGSSGEVRPGAAWATEFDGELFLVVYPVADASCEDAGDALGNDPDWQPTAVYEAGGCSMSVHDPEFDGSLTVTDGTILDATVSVSCAMDDGEWEDQGGDDGWQYSGPWWQGSPETFSLTVTAEGDNYHLTVAMDTYSGQFIYDLENPEPDPGAGAVTGDVAAQPCDELAAFF